MTAAFAKPTRNIVAITIIAVLIFFGGMLMLHAVPATTKDKIADGLLADFVITFPALYYFIVIRPLKISAKKLLIVISLSCGVAYLVLPQHQREYILQVRKLTAVAEIVFIIYAVTKFNKLRKLYLAHKATFADPIFNLRNAMAGVMGESFGVKIIASELAVLRYGLLFWKKEPAVESNNNGFSTHREFGYIALWCVFIFAMMVEIVAFHFLLRKWSNTAAIIVTVLSCYSFILFIADLSAILKRKILVNNNQLILRTGLRWRAVTTISNVSSVEKIRYDYHSTGTYFKGGITSKSGNLLITFNEPVLIEKLYGASRSFNTILMNIDDVELFASLVSAK
ncbi:hypothetical protein [Mucilaginibacter flavidus]|uniref:hypothetical protein n=1 Tax=Mucilaginibacter flavidus TaxID=2949309 RepID=UPI002092A05C|nr:hypothetical protein [Mucilaginibacter flavidus]MCO5949133.1 hypothetical protein [Mucilaginibacter flavidus]